MRAATNPFTSRVASKASNTATSSGSGSNWAKISAKARALNSTDATSDVPDPDATSSGHSSTSPSPSALPNPARRTKWTGKSFATLTLEALRGASSANHMLTINQITTYIEAYRRTTDMSLPALPQTIRAAVHRNCKPKKANGLWEHVPDEGKRTGRYRLLVEGLVGDVEDVEEGEEEEVEEEEKGESEGCEEL
jgi:hypothetical protein